MSTVNGSLVELSGRLLARDDTGIDFLAMPFAKRLRVPILEEATGAWRNAPLGATITIRITQNLAERSGLFSGGVMTNRPIGGVIKG